MSQGWNAFKFMICPMITDWKTNAISGVPRRRHEARLECPYNALRVRSVMLLCKS